MFAESHHLMMFSQPPSPLVWLRISHHCNRAGREYWGWRKQWWCRRPRELIYILWFSCLSGGHCNQVCLSTGQLLWYHVIIGVHSLPCPAVGWSSLAQLSRPGCNTATTTADYTWIKSIIILKHHFTFSGNLIISLLFVRNHDSHKILIQCTKLKLPSLTSQQKDLWANSWGTGGPRFWRCCTKGKSWVPVIFSNKWTFPFFLFFHPHFWYVIWTPWLWPPLRGSNFWCPQTWRREEEKSRWGWDCWLSGETRARTRERWKSSQWCCWWPGDKDSF